MEVLRSDSTRDGQLIAFGNRSLVSMVKRVVDPAVAQLLLAVVWWLYREPFDRLYVLVAVLTFSLTYPGSLPFRTRQLGLFGRILSDWLLVVMALVALAWATGSLYMFNLNAVGAWFVATPFAVWGLHVISPWLAPKVFSLKHHSRAVVIGVNDLGLRLSRSFNRDSLSPTRVVGFFDDRGSSRLPEAGGLPLLGRLDQLKTYLAQNKVDQIYITLPMASQPRILALLDDLRDSTASVYFVPDIFLYDLIQARVDSIDGLPVVAVCETPFYGTAGILKRWSDIAFSLFAIALTAPVMLAVALAVKLSSPGPVLFKQRRYGVDGSDILVWKFRSMRVMENGEQIRQATKDDDRVTPVGRFIRRTSLDELPQFFNVLQGRMSVVGPRPHAVAHNELYRKAIKGYMIRHKVKPGITGWAQVNGARGETDTIDKMERRVELDLWYLRNWSLKLDAQIILRTVTQVFKDPGAY